MSMLKKGDMVNWRGAFGNDEPKLAKVEEIEVTNGGKYGKPVNEIDWGDVKRVVVTLDNGHWAYGSQLSSL